VGVDPARLAGLYEGGLSIAAGVGVEYGARAVCLTGAWPGGQADVRGVRAPAVQQARPKKKRVSYDRTSSGMLVQQQADQAYASLCMRNICVRVYACARSRTILNEQIVLKFCTQASVESWYTSAWAPCACWFSCVLTPLCTLMHLARTRAFCA